jgi:hypothetical protein
LLLTAFLGFFAAEFPDDAALPKLTIDTRVGAGLAFVKTFLAVIVIHFLAMDASFPIGMKAAMHRKILVYKLNMMRMEISRPAFILQTC